ncbi:MAG TPA: rhodanese-related sulfurtransferase [Saprospiraceae bacterium]|nr:rhodanese-related sulfurtransferase [Saprospiraceae bacterium]
MAKQKLFNMIDSGVLKEQLQADPEPRTTLSFYRYFCIPDVGDYRERMYAAFDEVGVLGRIYVSTEGVNAQISVPDRMLSQFQSMLSDISLDGVRLNIAIDDNGKSFYKLIVRVREKIVADGLNEGDLDFQRKGKHLSSEEFNEITDRPGTILVDMRNHYESEVGHFEGAILPDVETFRESLPIVAGMLEEQKDKPVVMYCTGGIRCEKASAYMKSRGFENVYQLDGGIIEYARQVKQRGLRNKFHGKNFVFDERLGERISDEIIATCHQCGAPADTHVNCANDACHILFIQCESCQEKYRGCCSERCADFIQLPEKEQRERRKTEVFNGTKFGRYGVRRRFKL